MDFVLGVFSDFRFEIYFSCWEFKVFYYFIVFDVELCIFEEFLFFGLIEDCECFYELYFGYILIWGMDELREVIVVIYEFVEVEYILVFVGVGEVLYWVMQFFVGLGDQVIVMVFNYQLIEFVLFVVGVEVVGLLFWSEVEGE